MLELEQEEQFATMLAIEQAGMKIPQRLKVNRVIAAVILVTSLLSFPVSIWCWALGEISFGVWGAWFFTAVLALILSAVAIATIQGAIKALGIVAQRQLDNRNARISRAITDPEVLCRCLIAAVGGQIDVPDKYLFTPPLWLKRVDQPGSGVVRYSVSDTAEPSPI